VTILRVPVTAAPGQSGLATWVRAVANAVNQIASETESGVGDGDKGDIIVSDTGATWEFDSSVVSAFARTILDDTTAADVRSTIGAQAEDAQLTDLAGLSYTGNANKVVAVKATEDGFELVTGGAGGLADGDYGDITVGGTGTTLTIDAGAVTYAKMQDAAAGNVVLARANSASGDYGEVSLAASRLLGRGSTGDIAAISLDPGLEFNGTVLRTARGTGFPGSPASGDRFLRTDRNIDYFYDGTRWLSTQVFTYMPSQTFAGQTVDAQVGRQPVPFKGLYDIYMERWQTVSFVGASVSWDLSLRWADLANTFTVIATNSTTGDATNNWSHHSVNINAVLNSGALLLDMFVDELSGTATCSAFGILYYRLVG
jgi:hypothetical protein